MNSTSYLLLALIALFSVYMLRICQPRLASLLSALCVVTLSIGAFALFETVSRSLDGVIAGSGLMESSGAVLKTVGVGVCYSLCADTCRELGEIGLAEAVIMLGRVEILAMSVPTVMEILELCSNML